MKQVVALTTYTIARKRFMDLLQKRENKFAATAFPNSPKPGREASTFTYTEGNRYDKVIMNSRGSRSSYCYIDRENGDLLKGNWKGVEAPKVARGNIYGQNPLEGTNEYGIAYLLKSLNTFRT